MGSWALPLQVPARDLRGPQPVTLGVPFPRGMLSQPHAIELRDATNQPRTLQTQPLAHWPDGSVQWLLLDFLLEAAQAPFEIWKLLPRERGNATEYSVAEQVAAFRSHISLTDPRDRELPSRLEQVAKETEGALRTTRREESLGSDDNGCRIRARWSTFAGTGLTRLDLTLHNPRAAKHTGGLWDLGDPGSFLFRDLTVVLTVAQQAHSRLFWRSELHHSEQHLEGHALEIYQGSSGSSNWRSRVHVNRAGQAPLSVQGYRVRAGEQTIQGDRAEPLVRMVGEFGTLTVAVPDFWQQFPKAMEVEGNEVRVRLFPRQFGDLFELQGGERKTHTIWLHFAPPDTPCEGVLDWVYRPVQVRAAPEWYANAEVIPALGATPSSCTRLDALLAGALEGEQNLFARQEVIDEYGWRNFGEVYADHEAAHFQGTPPIISHYNNQYDVLLGMLLQYLRTGDARWFALAGPLARHVLDIDIYHTEGDRAAYNGGLFWHTDHYRDAGTATHRAYSRVNRPADGKPYGGGPSNEHNYTSGLLLYHYLTGNPDAADAVRGLADWVVRMDDGRTTILGLVDDGPTGFASKTRDFDYHGPGRGAGNSINALLDAWQLDGDTRALQKAEELIRRCIHPADDVPARDLQNVEDRWSYTVFLEVLGRYLRQKIDAGQLDFMYAYARSSLLHYAAWMGEHEEPYFDHPERLEYPTETWAAQDFRKAHVLRLAATHADEPDRVRLLARATELADRAWNDLERFPTRTVARSLAIMMTEGLYDAWFRSHALAPAPSPVQAHDFGAPASFVSQKRRVMRQLRTPAGMCRAGLALLNPLRWWRVFGGRRG